MKFTGLILCWLLATAAGAQTNQSWKVCRNPVRVFKGQGTVDLTPLFAWWARQPLEVTNPAAATDTDTNGSAGSDRPLPAWARVTGAKVGTIGSSWLVNAVIYTSPTLHTNARIILNHPPAVEAETYEALKTEWAEATRQIAHARETYSADTNAEARAEQRAQAYSHSRSKLRADGFRDYSALAAKEQNAAGTAQTQMDQLEAARAEIEEQLKTMPAVNGNYYIDWFAVLRGRSKQGVPIYDLGLVSASPP